MKKLIKPMMPVRTMHKKIYHKIYDFEIGLDELMNNLPLNGFDHKDIRISTSYNSDDDTCIEVYVLGQESVEEFAKRVRIYEKEMNDYNNQLKFQNLKEANIDEFMEKLSKAASLGSSQNFGHDYQEDFEKRYETDLRDTITLGDELLDEYTGGGISTGELFVKLKLKN